MSFISKLEKTDCSLCVNVFWSAFPEREWKVPSLLCRDFALTGRCDLFDDKDEDGQERFHDGMMLVHAPIGTICDGCQREILMDEFDLETPIVLRP